MNKGSPFRNGRGFQLVKKVLTSWWTGEQAPPPLPPPPDFARISSKSPSAKSARKRFLLWKMRFSAAKILPSPPYTPLGTIGSSRGSRPSRTLPGFSTVWKPLPEWKGLWRGTLMCRAKRLADEGSLFRRERLAWGWTNEPRETTDDVKRLADEGSPFRNGRGFDVGRMQLLKYVVAI